MKYVSQCTQQLSPGCTTTSECLCVPAPPRKTIRVVEQTNKWASRPSCRAVDKVCVVTVVSPSQRSIFPLSAPSAWEIRCDQRRRRERQRAASPSRAPGVVRPPPSVCRAPRAALEGRTVPLGAVLCGSGRPLGATEGGGRGTTTRPASVCKRCNHGAWEGKAPSYPRKNQIILPP